MRAWQRYIQTSGATLPRWGYFAHQVLVLRNLQGHFKVNAASMECYDDNKVAYPYDGCNWLQFSGAPDLDFLKSDRTLK